MSKKKEVKKEKAHAKYSASNSKRWLECAGSIRLSENAPRQESEYAVEGTDAHECVETFLKNLGTSPRVTRAFLKGKYPEEMIDYAEAAYHEISRRFKESTDAEFLCETKVSLEFVSEGMFGTVDSAIVEEFGRLTVIDYKYGAGIAVDPEENSQMLYYALGIAHRYNYNFEDVALVIIQPRAEHSRGPIREWVTSIDTLKEWAVKFGEGVKRASEPDAPLKAGDHCKFCPAAAVCPEVSKKALGKAKAVFGPIEDEPSSEITLPEPFSILDKNLGEVLSGISQLEEWIDAVRTYALNRAQKGKPISGWKLVEKRSTRKWINAEKVEKLAIKSFGKKALTEPKLLSPAQLEEAFPKNEKVLSFVSKNTSNVSSGVTLVPSSDRRDPVNSGPAFPALEKEGGKPTKTKAKK